ncbi:MAG: redoxin domain-containing protein [bacterium]|nr:redoxin domain-containing protein [bacterium]
MSMRQILISATLWILLAAMNNATASGPIGSPVLERPTAERESSSTPGSGKKSFPDLKGVDLNGNDVSLSDYRGKRLVLVFYRPDDSNTHPIVDAAAQIADLRHEHGFEILGVSIGTRNELARAFAVAHNLDFSIIDDASGDLSRYMRLKRPAALTVIDGERHVLVSQTGFAKQASDLSAHVEGLIREALRLPRPSAIKTAMQLEAPLAADFEAELLGGGRFKLSEARGKPVALVFFLHNCSYCRAALTTLKEAQSAAPEDRRATLIGIETSGQVSIISSSLKDSKLDFFPVIVDSDWALRTKFGVFGDVPVIVMIDAEGRIVYRTKPGWYASRDPAIVTSWMARLTGLPVPMMLPAHGFSGSDLCGACHATEYTTWQLTSHASAYDTLVKHGATEKAECVKCHVVGFDRPGGFSIGKRTRLEPSDFEDVGCESCHGRGGPHQSPDLAKRSDYEPVCRTCHDSKHSLGFEYSGFLPKISHRGLAALSQDELQTQIAARDTRHVLPTHADFVGSDSCRTCHSAEFETWQASPHAQSMASLASKKETRNPKCQRCHTTGFGRPGGFPEKAGSGAHEDVARVGCESCHGPGGDHVGENAARVGTIVSLTDKCDSCAIQKVCGSCHDEANDPDFAFDIEAHIERQRHGTTQPAVLRKDVENQATAIPSPAH